MKTYSTIKEAFANGFGDVFFTKNNQFICESRHSDFTNLLNDGFELMSYQQVVDLDNAQKSEKKIEPIATVKETQKSVNMVQTNCVAMNYYDEYPDAWNQSL